MTTKIVNFTFKSDFSNKKEAAKELTGFKNLYKSLSKVKVDEYSKPKNNQGDYTIKGTCVIDLEAASKSFLKSGKTISISGMFIELDNASMKTFIKAETAHKKNVEAEKKAKIEALELEFAHELVDLPKGTIYLYEHGECRGEEFELEGKISAADFKKKLFTSVDVDDWLENSSELINNIFYNSLPKNKHFREVGMAILNRLLKGKAVLTSWEEGTTGMSMNRKKLIRKVDNWEGKARMQNQPTDTLVKIVKKQYLK